MISKYEVLRYFREHPQEDMTYDAEKDVFYLETGKNKKITISADNFTQHLREEIHCDFDVIYSDVLDNVVYRCNECGCVIITGDDERYDPNLCCPDCGKYHPTHGEIWYTKADQQDPEIKKLIKHYAEMDKSQRQYDEWLEKRRKKQESKGKQPLNADELWRKEFFNKDKSKGLSLSLKVSNLYFTKLKGLYFSWHKLVKEPKDLFYTCIDFKKFPLSPYAVYLFWIFPHTKEYKKFMTKQES